MLIEFNLPEFCKDNCPKFTPRCETFYTYGDNISVPMVVMKKCENADICRCAVDNYRDYKIMQANKKAEEYV